jgi:hypothetical protein
MFANVAQQPNGRPSMDYGMVYLNLSFVTPDKNQGSLGYQLDRLLALVGIQSEIDGSPAWDIEQAKRRGREQEHDVGRGVQAVPGAGFIRTVNHHGASF